MNIDNMNNTNTNNMNNIDNSNFDTKLIMYKPLNILVLLSFYSPIFIVLCVLSMSFIFQNFKGFIYLGFLLACAILREFLLMLSGSKNNNTVCDAVQYGNTGFSIFVISFTICYICMPMFLNNDVNYSIFGGLLTYLLVDIGLRYYKSCITEISDILLNLITGAAAGLIIPGLMYSGGSSKYLFFNEISSNKEICSMPKKQQFKCKIAK